MTAVSPTAVVEEALRPDGAPVDGEIVEGHDEAERWQIDDRRGAAWALGKIRQAAQACDDDLAEHRAAIDALEAEARRLRDECAQREAQRDRTVSFFEAHLTDYLRRERDRFVAEGGDPDDAPKSIRLPGGRVASTAGRDRVTYGDAEKVAAYAAEHGYDFATYEPKITASVLLRHVKDTGEVPPTVELVKGERSYRVEID